MPNHFNWSATADVCNGCGCVCNFIKKTFELDEGKVDIDQSGQFALKIKRAKVGRFMGEISFENAPGPRMGKYKKKTYGRHLRSSARKVSGTILGVEWASKLRNFTEQSEKIEYFGVRRFYGFVPM